MTRAALLLLAASLPAAAQDLLAPERLARLPAGERAAWERYLETSRRLMEVDRETLDAERAALGARSGPPAPSGPPFVLGAAMTADWFRGAEARRLAHVIVSFQTPSGGWSKNLALDGEPRRKGQGYTASEGWEYVGTFDNGATTEQLRFLGRVVEGLGDESHRRALEAGVEYVLRAQFPNGCWPQVYPLVGGYHDAATYNDDATVRILELLQEVDRPGRAWVTEDLRARARSGLARGVECLLASQVEVGGRDTVWAAQHDPLTLQPVKARAYEHASLSGQESAGILAFLMGLSSPDERVAAAVRAAAAWFRENAILGFAYEGRELKRRAGAGPLWARFYEIGTNRPIFSNRDGIVRYRWEELGDERRRGYAWYTEEPAVALRAYDAWAGAR
jgi:PelA/Pel-15E family pectate lyase